MAAGLDQARLVGLLKDKKHAGLAALCRALITQLEEQAPRHSEDLSSCMRAPVGGENDNSLKEARKRTAAQATGKARTELFHLP